MLQKKAEGSLGFRIFPFLHGHASEGQPIYFPVVSSHLILKITKITGNFPIREDQRSGTVIRIARLWEAGPGHRFYQCVTSV